jgi:hypothetical protein
MVWQRFIELIAQVPAVGDMIADGLHHLALGADALKEHDELQLEEHHRVDARSSLGGIAVRHPLADEAQVQRGGETTIEIVRRDQRFQGGGDGVIQAADFGRAEHEPLLRRG